MLADFKLSDIDPADFQSEWWRLNNLYKIVDKDSQVVTLKPNVLQEQFYRNIHHRNIILKARQIGYTTFIDTWMFDRAILNPHTNVGIIAHTDETVKSIFEEKVMFPFEHLPPDLIERLHPDTSNAKHLKLANGSSIRVARSMRGKTLQYLHVSEYGIVCYEDPKKAREIRTGALNAVSVNNFIFIESTARGDTGDFHHKCMVAKRVTEQYLNGTAPFTPMDYWFHFAPWWEHNDYQMPGYGPGDERPIQISDADTRYFDETEEKVEQSLSHAQRVWYVKKRTELEEEDEEEEFQDMKQEYPATVEEAFENTIKGAIFGEQMTEANEAGRICDLPFTRGLPVNVFWDLGKRDINAMWFHQRVGPWDYFLRYYQNNQKLMPFYVEILEDYARRFHYTYGKMYLPHDGKSVGLTSVAGSAADILKTAGFRVKVVKRPPRKNVSIDAARIAFSHCKFDKTNCKVGLTALRNYVFRYDEKTRTYDSTPKEDEFSHGADGFQTYALGYKQRDATRDEAASVRAGAADAVYTRATSPYRQQQGNHMV